MRILFINQAFHPDVVATAQYLHDLARDMVSRGHEVHVLCGRSLYGQTGASLPKYERLDGIHVHRTGGALFGRRSAALRGLDFGLLFIALLIKAVRLPKPDVVVTLTSPPLVALAGVVVKAVHRSRFAYWLMDLYPDLPVGLGMLSADGVIAQTWDAVHRFCLKRADRVVVLGEDMKRLVIAKDVDESRVSRVHIWAHDAEVAADTGADSNKPNAFRSEWALTDKFSVMYSGNFGLGHDVQTMLGAAEALKDDSTIAFVFSGGGQRKKEVEAFVAERGLSNAQSKPYQPRERLHELILAGDVHIVTQMEHLRGTFVPSKLMGVMAAGRPVVYVGHPDSEDARIITECDCGVVIRVGDVAGLVRTLRHLRDKPIESARLGANGKSATAGTYGKSAAMNAWEQVSVR